MMKPTPNLLRRCSLQGCELQAHFTLSDGRVICDKHAYMFGLSNKRIEMFKEFEAQAQGTDLLEELEEGKYLPGDEHNGLKPEK